MSLFTKKDDEILFTESEIQNTEEKYSDVLDTTSGKWKILIVDDEEDIHAVTKMVLKEIKFKNKEMEFFSAYNENDAKKILSENNDIALVLLDVVMENENSGLRIVDYIRNNLKNANIRIILRTGYPGQAPERKIIIDYDINDYKEKTELSSQKLITSIISALRSYEDIITISELNKTLEEKVAERTKELNLANKKLVNLNEQLTENLLTMEKDMQAGRMIQLHLLPQCEVNINNILCKHYLKPSLYLSGDFVDYFKINDHKLLFYFVDVSGHGSASAFVTIFIKNFIDTFFEKIKAAGPSFEIKPELIATKLNEKIISEKLDKFATMFIGIIDLQKKELTYVNAGQFPYPILNTEDYYLELKSGSSPVGMFKTTNYTSKQINLENKYSILIVSDGLFEIMKNVNLNEKQKVLYNLFKDSGRIIERLLDKFEINTLESIPDDITFMLIEHK